MASTDFTEASGGLGTDTLLGAVTGGLTPPNGGGAFVYGFRSAAAATGARALITNQTNFYPMAEGGRISGGIMRGVSTITTGFAPFFAIGIQASGPPPSVLDNAYLIGLEDTEPHRVVVRKGSMVLGIPAATAENSLMRSKDTKVIGSWWHILLDMIVNPSGDVVLRAFFNDLASNPVTAPIWEELDMEGANDGINGFIDDALGAASGSVPYVDGYAGFAGRVEEQGRRMYYDHIRIARQL